MTNSEQPKSSIALALWGDNGHQIHGQLPHYPRLKLAAFGAFDPETSARLRAQHPQAILCDDYETLLAVPGLELVSLYSPRRLVLRARAGAEA